jgi:hypothetical protein
MIWTPNIRIKRKIYDGVWVYDHEDVLLGKVVRYNPNYKLWQIALYDQESKEFDTPCGFYSSQKEALNDIRSMYNYPEVA